MSITFGAGEQFADWLRALKVIETRTKGDVPPRSLGSVSRGELSESFCPNRAARTWTELLWRIRRLMCGSAVDGWSLSTATQLTLAPSDLCDS